MKTRNILRLLTALFITLAALGLAEFPTRAAEPPVQGASVPALAEFDKVMQGFMTTNNISAGQLSVRRNGKEVFNRAYGWQDETHTKPLQPDVLMRVASVTKPFTAAAIHQLVAQGKLSLTTNVFNLGQPGGGVLTLQPFGTPDARLKDITILHCLRHRGGWDRTVAGDLTYFEIKAARAMNVPSPPGRENLVRFIMGQPLQSDPGGKEAYSNIGYLLLGLVIEKISGQDFIMFLRESVTLPAGIAESDLQLGRSLRVNANSREPYYDDLQLAPNVFFPEHSRDAKVAAPYGSFDMEARTSQGRIITNARSLALFLDKFMVNGEDIGKPRIPAGNWRYNHCGLQRGSEALARARGDGVNYAVIFNKANQSGGTYYAAQIRMLLDTLIDSGKIKWPNN